MTDQQGDWWNSEAPRPTPPQRPAGLPSSEFPTDPDATVVVAARQPGDNQGNTFSQQPPPPHGAPAQGFGVAPQQAPPAYGGPQFVDPAAASTGKYRAPGGSITMIAGAIVAILGTFLPWVMFGDDSVNGYEEYFIGESFDAVEWANPGAWVVGAMIVVVIAAVIVLAAGRHIATWIVALLATSLGSLMTLAALGAVGSVINNAFPSNNLGIGPAIVLCLVGAIIAGVGAIIVAARTS